MSPFVIISGCLQSDKQRIIGNWVAYEGYTKTQDVYLGFYIIEKNVNLTIRENYDNLSIFLKYEIKNDKLIFYENNQSDILDFKFIDDDSFLINFIENDEQEFLHFIGQISH